MGRQCSVSGCLNKQLKVKKVTFFKAPKSIDTRNKWSRLLGCLLTENSYICEQHFHSSDIKSAETVNDAAGNVLYNYQFKKKILLKDALPFKHNNSSIDEHKDVATKMITLDSNEKTESELCNENMNCHTESYNEIEMEQTVMNCQEESSKSNLINLIKEIEIKQTVNSCITSDEIEDSLYDKIIKQEVVIKFPRSEWGVHCCLRKKLLVFSVIEIMPDSCSGNVMIPIYTKQVILNSNCEIKLLFLGKNFEIECARSKPKSAQDIENLIAEIDALQTCLGGPSIKYYRNIRPECAYRDQVAWRHKKCPIIVTAGSVCTYCVSLHKTLSQNVDFQRRNKLRVRLPASPTVKSKIQNLFNQKRVLQQQLNRNQKKLSNLSEELNKVHERLLNMK